MKKQDSEKLVTCPNTQTNKNLSGTYTSWSVAHDAFHFSYQGEKALTLCRYI